MILVVNYVRMLIYMQTNGNKTENRIEILN